MSSLYEAQMAAVLKQYKYKFVTQYRFCKTRRWTFDFVLEPVETKIAIECNGSIWTRGRHTYGQGYINDLEKINTAQLMGWIVLQYCPETITKVIDDLRMLRNK